MSYAAPLTMRPCCRSEAQQAAAAADQGPGTHPPAENNRDVITLINGQFSFLRTATVDYCL